MGGDMRLEPPNTAHKNPILVRKTAGPNSELQLVAVNIISENAPTSIEPGFRWPEDEVRRRLGSGPRI